MRIESNGIYRDMTEEEISEIENIPPVITEPTQQDRIAQLEVQNSMLLQCVLEMSEIIYA